MEKVYSYTRRKLRLRLSNPPAYRASDSGRVGGVYNAYAAPKQPIHIKHHLFTPATSLEVASPQRKEIDMSTPHKGSIPTSEAMTDKDTQSLTNMDIYENYKVQFQRLKKAMDNHFYLEAIMIEYAIMEDRTASILAYEGSRRRRYEHKKIREKLEEIKERANQNTSNPPWIGRYFSDDNSDNLIDRIIDWNRQNRNPPTHRLMRMKTTTEKLRISAILGRDLCKDLSSRANNYKRMVERKTSQTQGEIQH